MQSINKTGRPFCGRHRGGYVGRARPAGRISSSAGRSTCTDKQGGYIAIVTSVVITTLVGIVALVFSSSNFLGRYDTLALEEKGEARALAEGCVEYARLRLAVNPSYSGNETVTIASTTCRVVSVTPQGDDFRVVAAAAVRDKVTNVTVMLGDDLTLLTIGETP